MKLHFYGGAGAVTGACYLLETKKAKILVDCGLFQGEPELEQKNHERFVFDPAELACVVITHAHLDHIGRLPQLVKSNFGGKIFATPPTIDFTEIILQDSARVLEEKARRAGAVSFFGQIDVRHVMKRFNAVDYYQKTEIAAGVFLTFYDAGHILGSAVAVIETDGKRIVFSGDLGNPPVPLLRPPDFLTDADYVLVESAYGDRNHESSVHCKEMVENIIEDTAAKNGVLLIPSFALERTQQLLYHLNDLVEHRRIPALPIYIDSPLAIHATEIYKKYPQYYNKEATYEIASGDDVFKFPGLHFTETSLESKKINSAPPPKVIIAGSGMSQGGRIMHHEVLYLPDPKNTLLMVTYQAKGTLGRRIYEGERSVEILDQNIAVRAKVEIISGYSAHGDQRYLMNWISHFRKSVYTDNGGLKKVFVVQGEEKPAAILASLITDEFGIKAAAPRMGDAEEL